MENEITKKLRYTVEETSDAFADPFIIRDNEALEGSADRYYDIDGIYQTFETEGQAQEYADALNNIFKTSGKQVLDVCCGSRMFWFDKNNTHTVFMDNRTLHDTLSDGRTLDIEPDVVGDFRHIPFPDNTFRLVVFDPPHLLKVGDSSWLAKKYGKLSKNWRDDLKRGFSECMRVLKPYSIMVFKWNEQQIKLSEVLDTIGYKPLFGDRRGPTYWLVFMKYGNEEEIKEQIRELREYARNIHGFLEEDLDVAKGVLNGAADSIEALSGYNSGQQIQY